MNVTQKEADNKLKYKRHAMYDSFSFPWRKNPKWAHPPHYRDFMITVLVLWASDQSDTETST